MAALVYVLLCLIWGSSWIAIKIGVSHAPPFFTAGTRFVIAVLILGAIALARRYSFPSDLKTALKVAYPGLYMYGLHFAFIYTAEQYIDSSLTAVLFGSFPFFVAILSHWRLKKDRIRGWAWFGLMIGFVGVVVITYRQWETSGNLFLGTILALIGTYVAAHGLVVHTVHHVKQNIIISAILQMTLGGVPLILAALIFEHPSEFTVNTASVGSILYLAIFATVFTFLSYYWLLRKTTAVVVSLVAFVTPVIAIVIGVVFFGESMSPLIILGTALILSGIVLVIRKPKSRNTLETDTL